MNAIANFFVRFNSVEPIRLRGYITAILAVLALGTGHVLDSGTTESIMQGTFAVLTLGSLVFTVENGRGQVQPVATLPVVKVEGDNVVGNAIVAVEQNVAEAAVEANDADPNQSPTKVVLPDDPIRDEVK